MKMYKKKNDKKRALMSIQLDGAGFYKLGAVYVCFIVMMMKH